LAEHEEFDHRRQGAERAHRACFTRAKTRIFEARGSERPMTLEGPPPPNFGVSSEKGLRKIEVRAFEEGVQSAGQRHDSAGRKTGGVEAAALNGARDPKSGYRFSDRSRSPQIRMAD